MQTIARKGKLVLKDGSIYEGELYGKRNAVGEVVFTTGVIIPATGAAKKRWNSF